MTYAAAVERLRAVAEASLRLTADLPNGVPNLAAAETRLLEGIPALAGEPLIGWNTLVHNARTIGGRPDDGLETSGRDALLDATLAGSWEAFPPHVSAETITVFDHAARPALRAGYRAARSVIDRARWQHGSCPACGSLPLLAELRGGKDGEARVLRCGRCTAAWSFARLACPACNERDHTQLRYLHVDAEVAHRRALCCLTCRFYLKEIARLSALGDAELFHVDLESVGLDTLALDAGYARAAQSQ